MPTKYECNICGKVVKKRGRVGHMKFSTGDHGDKNELPDNYADQYREVEVDSDEPDDSDESEDEPQSETESETEPESEAEDAEETEGLLSRVNVTIFDV